MPRQKAAITSDPNRRQFIQGAAASAFAFTYLPASVWGANERVNVACVGAGGKGNVDLQGSSQAGANIVAICDVDEDRSAQGRNYTEKNHPDHKFYRDFRVMLEKEERNIDAVTVSTPDHVHAHASVMAMRMGKHVYCQKPLSHSVWEARLMTEVAAEMKVATQMGNQAHSGEPIRRGVELVRAGIIGKVTEVHAYTNRPIWPQGMDRRSPKREAVPGNLDWDLWVGPAPYRDYSSDYCPFKWRGWWDFGTGALGDMACHIMDMPYWALGLGAPLSVEATSAGNTPESGPNGSVLCYRFPARGNQPPVKYWWYDGENLPPKSVWADAGLPELNISRRFDAILVGEKGKMFFGRKRSDWIITPKEILDGFEEPPKTISRAPSGPYREWLQACKGGPPALSNFAYSGPLTETVLLGNLAVRLGKKIEWDSAQLRATNAPEADALIHREYRKGWELS